MAALHPYIKSNERWKRIAYTSATVHSLNKGYDRIGKRRVRPFGMLLKSRCFSTRRLPPLLMLKRFSFHSWKENTKWMLSIMEGKSLFGGPVAGISGLKNPIQLSRKVMEKSKRHVFLIAKGHRIPQKKQGFGFDSDEYFYDELRYLPMARSVNLWGSSAWSTLHLKEDTIWDRRRCCSRSILGMLQPATSTGIWQ